MNRIELCKPIIIAGPCAAESRENALSTAESAIKRGIDIVRLSLWKPRTRPGFEGVGNAGIPWLAEVAEMGLIPATEVMLPSDAEAVINKVIKETSDKQILIWLGSRNQNHRIQSEIGRVITGEPRVMLMIKNQPWLDQAHWEGIIEHALCGGASKEQLLICHRGFQPGSNGNRNDACLEMAMDVKQKTGIPMIIDPSHIGGSVPNVLSIAEKAIHFRRNGIGFDGLIVEIHPNPEQALTDKNQQLAWKQFDQIRNGTIFQT
ncbi:MAG: hypothetical protein Q8P29_00190 [Candidatus Levybacteria bacterium]|nr:hypothetical protein [Candidatus Levybacteria bacterium]MDZ4227989.1 hypothetical protein [Candidatus Levybacteria bacterium]